MDNGLVSKGLWPLAGFRAAPQSLIAAQYVVLATSLPKEDCPADEVLAVYRLRWQIKLAHRPVRCQSLFENARWRRSDARFLRFDAHGRQGRSVSVFENTRRALHCVPLSLASPHFQTGLSYAFRVAACDKGLI
ncbi:hypothetical protein HLH21_12420, partial [Gluconacetobacter johannae]|nr:hypothetical protein [Gluconacetobacter johannae]